MQLERTISEMNQTFNAFKDRAASSALQSIQPELAQDLQNVALRFGSLASSTASNRSLETPAEEAYILSSLNYYQGGDRESFSTAMKPDAQRPKAVPYHFNATQSHDGLAPAPWGYTFSAVPDEHEQLDAEKVTKDVGTNRSGAEPIKMDGQPMKSTDQYLVNFPVTRDLIQLSTERLAPPSTYSFRESTFARRLLRAAYERAYRVMSDPHRNAQIIQSMCRFTFCFSNPTNVMDWVQKMASATTDDSLELWAAPQLHLGNAGLRYPRTSLDGADPPPSDWANRAPMGPQLSVLAETPVPDSMSMTEIIEMVGFQGEWFDPNDVEHYLKSKGLFLSEQSSWAELNVDAVPSLEAPAVPTLDSPNSSDADTDPPSPTDGFAAAMGGLASQDYEYPWDGVVTETLATTSSGGPIQGLQAPSDLKASSSSETLPYFYDGYAFPNLNMRKIVDVDKFVSSK